ncbi:MAG: glutaredoxin domain-containing protein [Oceanidesulfovibrio sp.]
MSKPTLYALSTCLHSAFVQQQLTELGVDHDTVYIDYLERAARRTLTRELEQSRSPVTFPIMTLNNGADMTKPKLFALSTCTHCAKVKELLISLNVDFDTLYVDRLAGDERNHRMRELRGYNPEISFPTLVVGDAVVIGAKEKRIREILLGE